MSEDKVKNRWSKSPTGEYVVGMERAFKDRMDAGVYSIKVEDGFFGTQASFVPVPNHSRGLILSEDSQAGEIVSTIERFWSKKEMYAQLGMVFKRGILLSGKQGGGKTSVLNMVYSSLVKNDGIVLVSYDDPYQLKMGLDMIRSVEPDRHVIVVMEDIERWAGHGNDAWLVELLDGTVQYPNTVFLATTNFLDSISDRIKNRPSRFDEVIEITPPSAKVREYFFTQLVESSGAIHFPVKAAVVNTEGFTFAMMKELFVSVVLLDKNFHETVDRLRKMDNAGTSTVSSKSNNPRGLAMVVESSRPF